MARATSLQRGTRMILAVVIALWALMAASAMQPKPTLAAITPCYVYTWIPWITGSVEAHGGGTINCDSPEPKSDEIRSILYENAGPLTWTRDDDWVYGTTYNPLNVVTEYYCDGHGTDDWWTKSRGRDNDGNYSYWHASLIYALTC